MRKSLKVLFILAVFVVSGTVSYASTRVFNTGGGPAVATPTPGGPDFKGDKRVEDLYSQGVSDTNAGDYKTALAYFDQANKLQPNNPDILNMLAHSQRRVGVGDDVMLDLAMENYWKALKIKPDFPEAREYMGETYLLVLLEQIDKLKGYGDKGKDQLDKLTQAFLDAAEKLKTSEKGTDSKKDK